MKKIGITSAIVFSLIISLPATIGGILGYYFGKHFTKKIFEGRTKIKPIFIKIKNWEIHFHHWFLSLVTFFSFLLSGYSRMIPLPLYGFLGGLFLEDIYWDRKLYKKHFYWQEKWYKIIVRKKKGR